MQILGRALDAARRLGPAATIDEIERRAPFPVARLGPALRALELALAILAKIEEHTKLIARQLQPRT